MVEMISVGFVLVGFSSHGGHGFAFSIVMLPLFFHDIVIDTKSQKYSPKFRLAYSFASLSL